MAPTTGQAFSGSAQGKDDDGNGSDDGDDDAPWTFVSPRGRRSRQRERRTALAAIDFHSPSAPPPVCSRAADASNRTESEPEPGSESESVVYIQTEHARVAARWREQPSCHRLRALVSAQAASHAPVTQAVCLGTGSFGGPLDAGESIRRAHVQVEAFFLLVGILERHSGQAIACFFQEPLYTGADREYLRGLGHAVVESPAASRIITPSTLVFAIHLPTREYLECLASAMPAILVGTSYDKYEELPQFFGDEAALVLASLRNVHRSFHGFDFPREKHDHCFSDTCIYWRPTKTAPVTE